MVIAIVVAVLAVGVIVYGYLRRAKIERLEREYLEQLAPAVPEPVAAGTAGASCSRLLRSLFHLKLL